MEFHRQLHIGQQPTKENFQPVTNTNFIKADGGLWSSSYDGKSSAWVEWCKGQNFETDMPLDGYILHVEPTAKVLTIHTYYDLVKLVERFGMGSGSLHDLLVPINFEALAEEYDGIWLTANGQRATRLTSPSLYGWDCESVHWFRWAFKRVEYAGKFYEHQEA